MAHAMLKYPFDAGVILQKRKKIKKEILSRNRAMQPVSIAVLGGSTTHDIIEILTLFLLDEDLSPSFYESEYGRFFEDACFGDISVNDQKPDIVYIHTGRRNLLHIPAAGETPERVEQLINEQFDRFATVWSAIETRYGSTIIQNNFELPAYRLLGNNDGTNASGEVSFIRRMNERFAEYARTHENFYINDINYLSACYGLDRWHDAQAWYLYKYQLAVQAIPFLAQSIANIVKSLSGHNKKALVLDLDNTLWGGVVGDDGVGGIEIGQETPMGQTFLAFQAYAAKLKSIGVMLAVNSKNDRENAIAGLNHPEGVLRPDDFSVIEANWDDKAQNMLKIAAQLNILPGALVFFDDNPFERQLVERQVPDAAVPEVGNPEDYIRVLDRSGFFEVTNLSADDLKRTEMIRGNLARELAAASYADYEEYLASLGMKAQIRAFEEVYYNRITQLTNKSNQFNLTTRRYQQPEIERIARDPGYITLYGKLSDCFGDNGVVSVIIGKIEAETLQIELWLMSCRVLKRGMEAAMLDALVSACSQKGVSRIRGYYFKTAKNRMVKTFFGEIGFALLSENEDESSVWELETTAYQPRNKHIAIINEGADA